MAGLAVRLIVRRRIPPLTWLLSVAAFLPFCLGTLPVLRHDWVLPPHDVIASIGTMSGWKPEGLGQAIPYPASFHLVIALALADVIVGDHGTYLLLTLSMALLVAYGAGEIASHFKVEAPWIRLAAATFALFNPWTYTQLSAGHLFMILAYGGSLCLVAEMLRPHPRPGVVALLIFPIAPQIQFLILAFPAYLYLAIRLRRVTPLLAWSCFALPVLVGVLSERSTLGGIPLTVSWERSQSILPGAAVLLRGYFARYDLALPAFTDIVEEVVLALVILGAALTLGGRHRAIALVAALAVTIAMGLSGPLAAPIEWAFRVAPWVGVFRELYDFIGLTAVCYVVLASISASRFAPLTALWVACGVALIAAWMAAPPLRITVDARTLPQINISSAPANTRFALIPAFQPMTYRDLGSGLDPEARVYPGGRTPVNGDGLSYPIDAALGEYVLTGNTSLLEALGVATIFERAEYRTSIDALKGQWALAPSAQFLRLRSDREVHLHPSPMVAASDGLPQVATLATSLDENAILSNDAASASGYGVPSAWRSLSPIEPVRASNVEYSAAAGWVDARLGFAERPDLAQPYGGAVTTNSNAVFPAQGLSAILVFLNGTLTDTNGQPVAHGTGWRWLSLSANTTGLRCKGLCLIAASGRSGAAMTRLEPHASFRPLVLECPITWFCKATLPPGKLRTVRVLTAYDPAWTAWSGRSLAHIRLGGVFNGWIAPPSAVPQRLVIVECAAAAMAAAEIIALATYFSLLVSFSLSVRRATAK